MIEYPNYIWKCPKCGYEEKGFEDGISPYSVWMRQKKCPKCKETMEESPIVYRGPISEENFKRR